MYTLAERIHRRYYTVGQLTATTYEKGIMEKRCVTKARTIRKKLKNGKVKEYIVLQKRHKRHCDCPIRKG